MKRPLALFAVSFFAIQLLAINLPQEVLLPVAAVLASIFGLCIFKKKAVLSVIFAAAVIALLWNVIYIKAIIKPNFKYINETHTVVAQVKSITQYSIGYASANIAVYKLDEKKVLQFNVKVDNAPNAQIGEYVTLNIRFKSLAASKRLRNYTDNVFLAADYIDGFQSLHKYSIYFYANNVQQYMSGKIQLLMPNENGDVAIAMAFGDISKLTWDIKNSFKAAGLSHLLVVSGMHLAAASGIAFLIFNLLFKKRQVSAVASILFIVMFALVTGITPSAIRAGIMLSIAYLGMCFYREADSFTSIALAGLIMCVYNPYICYDVGFLLSFTATLGVLYSNVIIKKVSKTKLGKNKLLFTAIKLVLLPILAALATMPILVAFNLGISVLGILFNIVVTPFVGIITAVTFVCVALSLLSILSPLALAGAFINSAMISTLLFVLKLADKIPWSLIYISGIGATLILLGVYALAFLQVKLSFNHGWIIIAAFFIVLSCVYSLANTNLINIAPISANQNSSILMWTNNKGVLFNRDKTVNVAQVKAFLKQNNISQLLLTINMHKEGIGINQLNAQATVNAYDDLTYACSYEPFADIIVNIQKQDKGVAALINIHGFTAAINNGEYNFASNKFFDAYISGISRGTNVLAKNVIVTGNVPKWLDKSIIKQNAKITVGKRNLYKINEGFYGFD